MFTQYYLSNLKNIQYNFSILWIMCYDFVRNEYFVIIILKFICTRIVNCTQLLNYFKEKSWNKHNNFICMWICCKQELHVQFKKNCQHFIKIVVNLYKIVDSSVNNWQQIYRLPFFNYKKQQL